MHPKLEPEILLLSSLDHVDWMARFKLAWKPDGNWRLDTGVALFGGARNGLFGNYNSNDQVYTELRYSF